MRKIKLLFAAMLCIVGGASLKAEPITEVSQLSNSKVYTVVTERGAWWADMDGNRMHYNAGITDPANVPNDANYQFAILKQGESYFLYSVGAGKFLQPQKSFVTIMPTALTITELGNGKMKMTSSNPNRAINIGGSQWTWDTWTNTDSGNTLTITEVGDFDATEAFSMLTTKVYTVSCERGTWAVTADKLSGHNDPNVSSAEEAKQFALFTEGGKMYVYSVGAEKFVKSDGSLFDGKGDPITFNVTNDVNYPYHFYFPLSSQIYFNFQNGAKSITFNNWSGQDEGSKYKIESVDGADVAAITAKATEVFFGTQTITYNIKVDGKTVATEIREQKVGETASISSAYTSKEFVSYEYSPSTIAIGTTEVTATATVSDLPFEVSTDFENAHWYNIKIGANQRYVGWEESEPYHSHAEDEATEIVRASTAYQWAFMGNPVSGIKVINKYTGANYSLTSEGKGENVNGSKDIPNTVLRSGNYYWDIHQNGEGFSLNLIGKSNYYINTHGGATGYFQIWESGYAKTDGGSRITVADVPDLATTITYNVKMNNETVFTTTGYGVIGTPVGEMPSILNRDFVTITGFDGEAIVTRDMKIELTATWNGPFEISTDVATAHWYDMAIRSTWYVTSDNKDGDGALKTVNANALGLGEDAYHWAFVGDPWHIQVFNKAEANNFGYPTKANQGVPSFQADTYYWTIKASTSSIKNSFVMNVGGTNLYINQYGGAGGSLKFWDSGNNISDAGSAFTVFDIPTDYAQYVADEITPSMESTAKYFVLKPAVAATVGYDAAYKESCTFDQYKAMKQALIAIDMTDLNNFVLPETGYYILKNKYYTENGLMGIDPTDANMYGDYAAIKDARNYVTLTKVGDKTYTISLAGIYAPATVDQSQPVKASTEAGTYTVVITKPGYAAFQADTESQYSCLHRRAEGDIVGWEATADASMWAAEDATSIDLTVGKAGYATTCLPFAVTAPEGVTVYTAKITEKDNYKYLALNKFNSNIPAETGVILKADEGKYNFGIVAPGVLGLPEIDNDLKGTLTGVAADGKYVLAKPEGEEVGFYLANKGNIAPFKAYLEVAAGVKGFFFAEEDVTGIANVNVNDNDNQAVIYNVAGQRVSKMQKGINIVNGKKVLR